MQKAFVPPWNYGMPKGPVEYISADSTILQRATAAQAVKMAGPCR